MFRRLGTLVWGALGVFHLWLFAQQAWSGQFDYAESVRWALALGLVGGIVALHRRGGSVFRDRRATAIWVLVALLHGPAMASRSDLATQALAETPIIAAQVLGAVAGLGLALALAVRGGVRAAAVADQQAASGSLQPARILDTHIGLSFLPRPPPVG